MPDTSQQTTSRETSTDEQQRYRASAYKWNTVAGILLTSQSVLMLIVITRVCDVVAAGVFTIAFAVANLFMNMGLYGMRKFQASDRKGEFAFRDYRASRVASTVAMIVFGFAYVAYTSITLGYDAPKTAVIAVMCLFKAVDVFEDVYTGAYQLADRLDVGQRMVSIRQIITLVLFGVCLVATADLLVTMVITTVATAIVLFVQIRYVRSAYGLPDVKRAGSAERTWKLLKQCFPLFAAAFLLFYIGNAPKYVIDATAGDTMQAYYGYLSMPVFAVNILATFVYNPMVTELTDIWQGGDRAAFLKRFARLAGIVVGITLLCVAAAAVAGVPVLNILYNTDVSAYLLELLILVAGGGFLAIATLANVGITIIRFQIVLVPLYVAMSLVAFAVAQVAVQAAGITGASWAYFATMGVTAAVFSAAFVVGANRKAHMQGEQVE